MTLRLGLLGTAWANDAILNAAAHTPRVDVVAVGSRSAERAHAYAGAHRLPRAHGSYEALLADETLDAVYVSLPNALHVEWTVRALEAGKHVLCEKPLAAGAAAAERCFAAARRAGRVLVEALMWRHHPETRRLQELLAEGAVGPVGTAHAELTLPLEDRANIRWDAALGGGALLDLGGYCLSAIRLAAGEPRTIDAVSVEAGGVDRRVVAVARCAADALGGLACAFDLPRRSRVEIVGRDGTLVLTDPWHRRDAALLLDGVPVPVAPDDPYRLELEDFARAVAGEAPPLLDEAETVAQARALGLALDAVRRARTEDAGGG